MDSVLKGLEDCHQMLRDHICRNARQNKDYQSTLTHSALPRKRACSHPSANQVFSGTTEDGETSESVPLAGLVPLPVLVSVIDTYFQHCHNQPYSFFHEQTFRDRFEQNQIPDYLLFAVLAIATRFSTHSFFEGKAQEAALTFANNSWKSVMAICLAGVSIADLMTVQTMILLSIVDFNAGHSRQGAAWVKIGLAVRIAQELRLMIDDRVDLSPVDQEERRRVFWSLYLVDRIVSCGRGRPPAILEASCQLQLPCDERSWRDGIPRETDTLDRLSTKSLARDKLGPFAMVIITAYIMSRAAQHMLQLYNIRSQDPPWDPNSEFASISSDLLYVESQFQLGTTIADLLVDDPHAIEDHLSAPLIVFSRALFYLSHCLLNHPFLLRHRLETTKTRGPSSFLERAFQSSRVCAKHLTNHLREAVDAGCPMNSAFYGYCAVVAGSIQALHLHSEEELLREEALQCVQSNIALVEQLGMFWDNVAVMADALKAFSADTLRFHVLTLPNPTSPPLGPSDREVLWSLVDYSTMSGVPKTAQPYHPDSTAVVDASLQPWLDLFGPQGLELVQGADRLHMEIAGDTAAFGSL
ncbi:fungal-specific transcription factor domain-containing protein [Aspergillus aurantiobrunneus]